MNRSLRALGALVGAGIIAAGCSTSSSPSTTTSTTQSTSNAGTITVPTTLPPATSTTTGSVPSCNTVTAAAGQSDGAAGTITGEITLANGAAASCTMMGYPTLAMVSAGGTTLPITMADGLTVDISTPANAPPSSVTLEPGSTAAFTYQYSDVISGSETSCPSSATVTVKPPGATASSPPIALVLDPCDNGTIRVSPVYPAG